MPQYSTAKHTPLSPRIYRNLFLAGRARPAAGGLPDAQVLIGETSPRGTGKVVAPLHVPARHALPGRELPQAGRLRRAARRRLRPPRLHDGVGPAVQAQGAQRRDDRRHRRGSSRRSTGPREAGAIPAKLPIHLTEFGIQSHAGPDPGRQPRQAGRLPRDRRAPRLPEPARRGLLAVPAARRPAEPERDVADRQVLGLRVGPAHERRQGQAGADRLPRCRSPRSARARRSRSGGSCAWRRARRR